MITGFYLDYGKVKYSFRATALRDNDRKMTGKFQYTCKNCNTDETTIVNKQYYNQALNRFKKQFD